MLKDLIIPFGYGEHSSANRYAALRERADPVVQAEAARQRADAARAGGAGSAAPGVALLQSVQAVAISAGGFRAS